MRQGSNLFKDHLKKSPPPLFLTNPIKWTDRGTGHKKAFCILNYIANLLLCFAFSV